MVTQNKQAVLFVHVVKAFYGMLVPAMIFYKKLDRVFSDMEHQKFQKLSKGNKERLNTVTAQG